MEPGTPPQRPATASNARFRGKFFCKLGKLLEIAALPAGSFRIFSDFALLSLFQWLISNLHWVQIWVKTNQGLKEIGEEVTCSFRNLI